MEVQSVADLVLMLDGSKRETSRIEFGAHQVVIVRNEEAKQSLPDEFGVDKDWVMTVSFNPYVGQYVGFPHYLFRLDHRFSSRRGLNSMMCCSTIFLPTRPREIFGVLSQTIPWKMAGNITTNAVSLQRQ